jgi:hypothetical protein
MHSHLSLLLALFLAGTAGCARSDKADAPASEFASVAEKFRAKTGRDRRAEGDRIQPLLPRCPKTWEKDIGTGTTIITLIHQVGKVLPAMSEQDLVSYFERMKTFGEQAAIQWAASKHAPP